MAHTHARAVVGGLISPGGGARLLWATSSSLDQPVELNGVLTEAADWEFEPDIDRQEMRQRIVAEPRQLLNVITVDVLAPEEADPVQEP